MACGKNDALGTVEVFSGDDIRAVRVFFGTRLTISGVVTALDACSTFDRFNDLDVVFVSDADAFPVLIVLILATQIMRNQTIDAFRPDATGELCKAFPRFIPTLKGDFGPEVRGQVHLRLSLIAARTTGPGVPLPSISYLGVWGGRHQQTEILGVKYANEKPSTKSLFQTIWLNWSSDDRQHRDKQEQSS